MLPLIQSMVDAPRFAATIEIALDRIDPEWPNLESAQATVARLATKYPQSNFMKRIGRARVEALLKDALLDEYSQTRLTAAVELDRLGYQPSDVSQQALIAIALLDWNRVIALGQPALEPLASVLTNHRDSDKHERVSAALFNAMLDIDRADALTVLARTDISLLVREVYEGFRVDRHNVKPEAIEAAAAQLPAFIMERGRHASGQRGWESEIMGYGSALMIVVEMFGDARCVSALATVARANPLLSEKAIGVLGLLLKRDARNVGEENLLSLADFEDVGSTMFLDDSTSLDVAGPTRDEPISTNWIRDLARAELLRRGFTMP